MEFFTTKPKKTIKRNTKKKKKSIKSESVDKRFPGELLKVYKSNKNTKIRVGKDYDGGYVIYDNIPTGILLSCGISNDDSFEHAFTEKYNCKCIAFDGSIKKLPHPSPNIEFIKKFVGSKNNRNYTNLHDLISKHRNIILKMDIEGSEYEFIRSLSRKQLNKINMIMIEFHSSRGQWGLFNDYKIGCFDKLNKTHVLCHIHANNSIKYKEYNGIKVPQVFECLYVKKKFVKDAKLNDERLPSKLDMRNVKSKPEISMNYPPFVN